jgi:hypothetical protein
MPAGAAPGKGDGCHTLKLQDIGDLRNAGETGGGRHYCHSELSRAGRIGQRIFRNFFARRLTRISLFHIISLGLINLVFGYA